MPELVKITPDVFPELYRAFLHDDDPLSGEADWRNVFDYQWQKEEDHSGYALMENGAAVGMIAMAFSQRQFDGNDHRFCNLHTWWVHEDYRGHSLSMLRPLFSMKDYTITHFTPCDTIRALTKRLGFKPLDRQLKLLLPVGPLRSKNGLSGIEIRFDEEIAASQLNEADRRIFEDHKPYRVGNMLITLGGESCYLLYTQVERYKFRYCHIHYVSNKELFSEAEMLVRKKIMEWNKVRILAVDNRIFGGLSFPLSFNFWSPDHAVYRPAEQMEPSRIDNLYSDIVMLRLTSLPHITHELAKRLPFQDSRKSGL